MLTQERELKFLRLLFFLFGFMIMAWLPRFAELKANLGLSNGEFGSLISTGAIGSLISLMSVGHLVHKYGVKIVMQLATLALALSMITLVQTQSTFLFLIVNIVLGGSISAFHISINSQGFSFQDRNMRQVITQLSGVWSTGALATSIVAGLLVDRISLALHVTVLSIAVFIAMNYVINAMTPSLIKANVNPEKDYKFSDLFRGFEIDTVVSAGLICAIMLEFSIGDWASIFVKEDMNIVGGLNTLPYILFTLAMIVGRLTVHHLFAKHSIEKLAKLGSVTAGLAFLASIFSVNAIGTDNQGAVLIILSVGFSIAGVGSSFLGPSFMSAANARSKHPSAVVIGQIGVTNIILVFIMRWVIAWTAQLTSLTLALAIPALMLLTVPLYAKVLKQV